MEVSSLNLKNLFRVKPVSAILSEMEQAGHGEGEVKLKRVLTGKDLVFLGIGAIIGAGIFVITGTAAAGGADHLGAGPAIVLSFLLTGIACGFSALCYAEFASMIPIAGSAYTYSYATLGEFVAWIIGWDLILEYMVASSAVAIGWSGYFNSFIEGAFGDRKILPLWLTTDIMSVMEALNHPEKYIEKIAPAYPDLAAQLTAAAAGGGNTAAAMNEIIAASSVEATAAGNLVLKFQSLLHTAIDAPHIAGIPICINLPAAFIVLAITVLLVVGISESAKTNNFIVILKFIILGIFVVVGIQHINPENWVPFMPNGIKGVQTGAAMIFFAYIGFDAISTAAEETKNPAKDLPIGIIGSLVVCTVAYAVVSAVLTGMCPWYMLGTAEPVATALKYVGENFLASYIISVGAVISLLAVMLVMLMAQPRIFFCMSRDGFMPQWLSKIHPKFCTPYRSTIINGIIVALIAGLFNINEVAELCNIGTLFAFIIVSTSIIILRRRSPELNRPFKTPWVPWIPLMGILTCFYLMLGLPAVTWIRFFVWLFIGLIIYFCYGMRHTRGNGGRPEEIPETTEKCCKGE